MKKSLILLIVSAALLTSCSREPAETSAPPQPAETEPASPAIGRAHV